MAWYSLYFAKLEKLGISLSFSALLQYVEGRHLGDDSRPLTPVVQGLYFTL